MLLLGSALVLAGGLGEAPRGAAEPVLRWDAPAGCPDRAAMVAGVERYVGRPLADEGVRARGRMEREAEGRYRLALELWDAEGAQELRALEDADCAVLSDVAALMIAVAIDPEAATRVLDQEPEGPAELEAPVVPEEPEEPEPLEEPEPPRAAEPKPEPKPVALTSASRAPPERRSCRPGPSKGPRGELAPPHCVALGVGPALQWGTLPRVGFGVSGEASLLWPRVRLSAGGAFFFARPARVDPSGTLGGDIRLGLGRVRGCGRLGRGTLEAPICAGLELGALRGQGVGIDVPRHDRLLWVAVGVDAGLGWSPVRRFGLVAQLGAVIPLLRQTFEIHGLGVVHTPSAAGLRAAVFAEIRLP